MAWKPWLQKKWPWPFKFWQVLLQFLRTWFNWRKGLATWTWYYHSIVTVLFENSGLFKFAEAQLKMLVQLEVACKCKHQEHKACGGPGPGSPRLFLIPLENTATVCRRLTNMPVPMFVSKSCVDPSRRIVIVCNLNPSNETPNSIWVTLGLRGIAVFAFPFHAKRSPQIATLQNDTNSMIKNRSRVKENRCRVHSRVSYKVKKWNCTKRKWLQQDFELELQYMCCDCPNWSMFVSSKALNS